MPIFGLYNTLDKQINICFFVSQEELE
uniref:Uncharacterized protein n=1 Tax=Arundo donax TaxID=35708 RepID=A0A0A9AC02_ARUDO